MEYEMFGAFYEKQKETSGKFATYAWLGSGIYLFAVTPSAHFFSWQALVYFIPGMFVAAIFFGIPVYFLQRIIVKGIMRVFPDPEKLPVKAITALGVLLPVFEVTLIYLAASKIVGWMVN